MAKETEVAPEFACPDCGRQMRVKAFLPPTKSLPGVAGYWCDDCKKEVTIETDFLEE